MFRSNYLEEELRSNILKELYLNSRLSTRALGNKLNVSHNTIKNSLEKLEKEYGLFYTLEINVNALGFAEGRIITIRLKRKPDMDFLKKRFTKDIFVQDAYLASGDFDLLLYVVGLDPDTFQIWQFDLRKELSQYGPIFKFSTCNSYVVGFFQIQNRLIEHSNKISNKEKRILILLNQNSRMKFKEIMKKAKLTQMKVIYAIKRLIQKGIIRKFTVLIQNPEKRIFCAYTIQINPNKEHTMLALAFCKKIIEENTNQITNDYSLIMDVNGAFDSLGICTFKNGEMLSSRGPPLLAKLWTSENPKIKQSILIDNLVGKWPFHLEDYQNLIKFVNTTINTNKSK